MKTTTPAYILTAREKKDLRILGLFAALYCRAKHQGDRVSFASVEPSAKAYGLGSTELCPECCEFLRYAIERRLRCPLETKPSCKHCTIHCYRPGHREKVREIMRFSGKRLILRGRLDLLWHYF